MTRQPKLVGPYQKNLTAKCLRFILKDWTHLRRICFPNSLPWVREGNMQRFFKSKGGHANVSQLKKPTCPSSPSLHLEQGINDNPIKPKPIVIPSNTLSSIINNPGGMIFGIKCAVMR
jgi:hypothetical protein